MSYVILCKFYHCVWASNLFFGLLIMFVWSARTNKKKYRQRSKKKKLLHLNRKTFIIFFIFLLNFELNVANVTQLLLPTRFDLHDQTARSSVDCSRNLLPLAVWRRERGKAILAFQMCSSTTKYLNYAQFIFFSFFVINAMRFFPFELTLFLCCRTLMSK